MIIKTMSLALAVCLAVSSPYAWADADHHHGQTAHSPSGAPGDPKRVTKVFEVKMLDSMRFEPSHFEVKSGQTVKFVITNTGKVPHEFGVGTRDEQKAHAEMMLADPEMKHEDGSVIAVEPGETKALIWRFGKAGTYEAACQVPGHYPAGMVATVVVKK